MSPADFLRAGDGGLLEYFAIEIWPISTSFSKEGAMSDGLQAAARRKVRGGADRKQPVLKPKQRVASRGAKRLPTYSCCEPPQPLMPPFESPIVVLNGFKERAEALLVQGMICIALRERCLTQPPSQQALCRDFDRQPVYVQPRRIIRCASLALHDASQVMRLFGRSSYPH